MFTVWQKYLEKYHSLNFFWQKFWYVLYAGAMFLTLYLLSGTYYLGTPRPMPLTWIDIHTPFLIWTFWIYVSDYFFLGLGGMLCKDVQAFKSFRKAFWATLLLHVLIFVIFPTEFSRQALPESGITAEFFHLLYKVDTTVNCFPSLHVSMTLLASFVISSNHRKLTIPAFIWGLAIVISTLTTKQHYWYDVVGGTVVALIMFFVVYRRYQR